MAETSDGAIERIPVQVDLRKKAPPLPAFRKKIDPVAAAEAAMEKLSFQFKNWMADEVDTINGIWKSVKTEGLTDDTFERLFRSSHDIKGQADTLGYPLAGQVATSLCLLMELIPDRNALPLPLMEKHIQAMSAIVAEKANEENPTGQMLVAALREVTGELLDKKSK